MLYLIALLVVVVVSLNIWDRRRLAAMTPQELAQERELDQRDKW